MSALSLDERRWGSCLHFPPRGGSLDLLGGGCGVDFECSFLVPSFVLYFPVFVRVRPTAGPGLFSSFVLSFVSVCVAFNEDKLVRFRSFWFSFAHFGWSVRLVAARGWLTLI